MAGEAGDSTQHRSTIGRPNYSRSVGPRPDSEGGDFRVESPPAGTARIISPQVDVPHGQQLVNAAPRTQIKPWLPTESTVTANAEPPGSRGAGQQVLTSPSANLAHKAISRSWMAICFGITFLIYVALVPHVLNYSSPPTGDQPFYLMQTLSLVQDRDLNLANNLANHDEDKFYSLAPHPPDFVGMGAPYPLPPTHIVSWSIRPSSEAWPFHLPGLPVLMVPAWIIGSWFSLWWPATIVFMCLVGSLVALNIFLLAHDLTGRLWIAVAVWVVMAFSNPLMTYSYLIFTELTTGLFAIYAFRRLSYGWAANGPGRLLLIGLCIAYIPWFSWRCVFISIPLILYALVQWVRHHRASRTTSLSGITNYKSRIMRHKLSGGALLLLPVLASAALTAWYNLFLYGQPLAPNRVPELSEGSPFLWPWQGGAEITHFVTTGFALMFDRLAGLLTFTPVYLLVAVGVIAMLRSQLKADRRLLIWIAIVCLPYVALLMSYIFWSGLWCPPARFLTAIVPFMAAPLSMSLLACRSLYRGLFAALALPGMAIMAILMYDPRLFWPGNALFGWLAHNPATTFIEQPIWTFKLDLWNALPDFSVPNGNMPPLTTAWITAASVAIVFAGYALMSRVSSGVAQHRRSWIRQGAAWLGAVVILGGGWYTMNYEYLKPHTMLTQVAGWILSPAPQLPADIAYLDGKVYVPAYDSPYLAELDTKIIDYPSYKLIKPTLEDGSDLPYTHPGSVRVGPDKLLYVLNNGPGQQAMYALKPDGHVVRQVALNGTAEIAVGLQFGSDGDMYVSDMRSGRVRKYGQNGGDSLAEWQGKDGGFNNVGGIAVDADGTVYAAETSSRRIQQLDAKGSFVRAFDLSCNPEYITINGDWLDASCGNGLVSINKKTGNIQHSRIQKGKDMQAPSGLTYAPDGTLYVVDGSMLYAYKVQH